MLRAVPSGRAAFRALFRVHAQGYKFPHNSKSHCDVIAGVNWPFGYQNSFFQISSFIWTSPRISPRWSCAFLTALPFRVLIPLSPSIGFGELLLTEHSTPFPCSGLRRARVGATLSQVLHWLRSRRRLMSDVLLIGRTPCRSLTDQSLLWRASGFRTALELCHLPTVARLTWCAVVNRPQRTQSSVTMPVRLFGWLGLLNAWPLRVRFCLCKCGVVPT